MKSSERDELLIKISERQEAMHHDLTSHSAKLDRLIPTVATHGTWIKMFKYGGSVIAGGLAAVAFKVIGGLHGISGFKGH